MTTADRAARPRADCADDVLIRASGAPRSPRQVDDVYVQRRRLWVRLREKGGKRHEMPRHHTLGAYLDAYLEATRHRRRRERTPVPTSRRGTAQLSYTPLPQANAPS